MSEIQDKINQILSNPEALKQVQSLGEQLGLSSHPAPSPPIAKPVQKPQVSVSDDMLSAVTRLAPLINSFKGEDDTTRLLHSLRPFLCPERQEKLDKAEKMLKMFRLLPMLRDNGIF